ARRFGASGAGEGRRAGREGLDHGGRPSTRDAPQRLPDRRADRGTAPHAGGTPLAGSAGSRAPTAPEPACRLHGRARPPGESCRGHDARWRGSPPRRPQRAGARRGGGGLVGTLRELGLDANRDRVRRVFARHLRAAVERRRRL
ncbi:MAG: hypothetical protein AVDCRST_MAG52-832, partial [uncultured Blastococcus sp.]